MKTTVAILFLTLGNLTQLNSALSATMTDEGSFSVSNEFSFKKDTARIYFLKDKKSIPVASVTGTDFAIRPSELVNTSGKQPSYCFISRPSGYADREITLPKSEERVVIQPTREGDSILKLADQNYKFKAKVQIDHQKIKVLTFELGCDKGEADQTVSNAEIISESFSNYFAPSLQNPHSQAARSTAGKLDSN